MNRIKYLRQKRGWNQEDLAKLLGVQKSAISKYETEKVALSAENIKKIADIFEVTTDFLICQSDIEFPETKQAIQGEQPVSNNLKLLIQASSNLSDEEIQKTREYVEFLKSQRK